MTGTTFDSTTLSALEAAAQKLQNDNAAGADATTLTNDVVAYWG